MIVEHRRHPGIRQIDDRQPARARRLDVDHPLRTTGHLNRAPLGRQIGGGRQRILRGHAGRRRARRPRPPKAISGDLFRPSSDGLRRRSASASRGGGDDDREDDARQP
jgi:hypothetical protein